MSKLHIYRKFGDDEWTKDADGDGTLCSDESFDVTMTSVSTSIRKGYTYQIRKGGASTGDSYECTAGAQRKGETATFKAANTADVYGGAGSYDLSEVFAPEATDYRVDISMSAATVQGLKGGGYNLYGFKAVQTSQQDGAPVVWFRQTNYSAMTEIDWQVQYQAYTSNDSVIPNGHITASDSQDIDLGQTMQVGVGGIGTVVDGGPSQAISIRNTTSQPFTCGISEMKGGKSNPLCAFPLYGKGLDVIAPIEKVLLMFATTEVNTGTVIEKAYSQGILIDLTSDNQRSVDFDINLGWSWGGYSWAQLVPANSNLVPLLIESPSDKAFQRRSLVSI